MFSCFSNQGSAVGSFRTEATGNECMDTDLSSNNPQGTKNPSDFEFSSWMLVSRRRGRARGKSTGSLPVLASTSMAAEENVPSFIPSCVPSRGTWIGAKSCGRGGSVSSRASRFHYYNIDQIPMEDPMPRCPSLLRFLDPRPLETISHQFFLTMALPLREWIKSRKLFSLPRKL